MILEKVIKQATNNTGYLTITKKQALNKAIIIIDNKIIKVSQNKTKIYIKKKYVGFKAYIYIN